MYTNLRKDIRGKSTHSRKNNRLPSYNRRFQFFLRPISTFKWASYPRTIWQPPSPCESFVSPYPSFHSVVILDVFETGVCKAGEARCSTIVSFPPSSGSLCSSGLRRCAHVLEVQLACSLGRRLVSVIRINSFVVKIYLATTKKEPFVISLVRGA